MSPIRVRRRFACAPGRRCPRPARTGLSVPHVSRCWDMRLAVQLYTLRDRLEADLEGTLGALAEAGAEEVELAGLYGRDADRDAADRSTPPACRVCSAHVALDRFEDEPDARARGGRARSAFDTLDRAVGAAAGERRRGRRAGRADRRRVRAVARRRPALRLPQPRLRVPRSTTARPLEPPARRGRAPRARRRLAAGRRAGPRHRARRARRPRPARARQGRASATDGDWKDVLAGDGELDWPAIARAAERAGATHLVVELDNPVRRPGRRRRAARSPRCARLP